MQDKVSDGIHIGCKSHRGGDGAVAGAGNAVRFFVAAAIICIHHLAMRTDLQKVIGNAVRWAKPSGPAPVFGNCPPLEQNVGRDAEK